MARLTAAMFHTDPVPEPEVEVPSELLDRVATRIATLEPGAAGANLEIADCLGFNSAIDQRILALG